jgi:hypothetical protein
MPSTTVNPQWLDFSKDFGRKSIQNADLLYVRNKDNGIFRLSYRFNLGVYNERNFASLRCIYSTWVRAQKRLRISRANSMVWQVHTRWVLTKNLRPSRSRACRKICPRVSLC